MASTAARNVFIRKVVMVIALHFVADSIHRVLANELEDPHERGVNTYQQANNIERTHLRKKRGGVVTFVGYGTIAPQPKLTLGNTTGAEEPLTEQQTEPHFSTGMHSTSDSDYTTQYTTSKKSNKEYIPKSGGAQMINKYTTRSYNSVNQDDNQVTTLVVGNDVTSSTVTSSNTAGDSTVHIGWSAEQYNFTKDPKKPPKDQILPTTQPSINTTTVKEEQTHKQTTTSFEQIATEKSRTYAISTTPVTSDNKIQEEAVWSDGSAVTFSRCAALNSILISFCEFFFT